MKQEQLHRQRRRPIEMPNEEENSRVRRSQKRTTYTSDETDSIFMGDASMKSGSPLPTSEENHAANVPEHQSKVDYPGTYPRRAAVRSQSIRNAATTAVLVPSDDGAPDSLYTSDQTGPESTDINEADTRERHQHSSAIHITPTPQRTRWNKNLERRTSDTRPNRSSSRRGYRSVRATKREESTPILYYPAGGTYPHSVLTEHCVVPITYPIESSVSPRQMYAIHCDPFCPQPSWIHHHHHHPPPQHPLTVISSSPFVAQPQYYVGPVHPTHPGAVGSLITSTSLPQMPIPSGYQQSNPNCMAVPTVAPTDQEQTTISHQTKNTANDNTNASQVGHILSILTPWLPFDKKLTYAQLRGSLFCR